MAPRESKGDAARTIFGEFKPPLAIALIGLPNAGKSSLVSAITTSSIVAEYCPLPTMITYEAHMTLRNPKFDSLCQIYEQQENVCELVKIMDSPGLIRGARIGEGDGNLLLEYLREADIIFHVLRAHEDETVAHVDGAVNVIRDLECIYMEIQLKDVEFIESKITKLLESVRNNRNDKSLRVEYDLCIKAVAHLREGKDIRSGKWNESEVQILETYKLLTAKPVVYLVNMSKADFQDKRKKPVKDIMCWVKNHGGEDILLFSGAFEQEVPDMAEDDPEKSRSMISKILISGFRVSDLIHFFTADPVQVKCWQVRRQTRADEVARTIGKHAASVEVMKVEDLCELGSETAVKDAGKCKQKPMSYIIQDEDVIFFRD